MTEDERVAWARSFTGRETQDGFLVLEAEPPLLLAPVHQDGPPLELGLGDESRSVELWPRIDCRPQLVDDRDASDGYAIWCLPEMSTIVVGSGRRRFVQAVLDGLEVRNVRPAA
jgi:hypothetical protein